MAALGGGLGLIGGFLHEVRTSGRKRRSGAELTRSRRRRNQQTMPEAPISDIVHIIQLAIAPVFLLVGIGSLLNVFTGRLARIVDRVRELERDVPVAAEAEKQQELGELAILARRMRYCQWAITMVTMAAILICVTVIVLFVSSIARIDFTTSVAWLFIAVMTALTVGVTLFFFEVTVAIRVVGVRKEYVHAGREVLAGPSLAEIVEKESAKGIGADPQK